MGRTLMRLARQFVTIEKEKDKATETMSKDNCVWSIGKLLEGRDANSDVDARDKAAELSKDLDLNLDLKGRHEKLQSKQNKIHPEVPQPSETDTHGDQQAQEKITLNAFGIYPLSYR